MKKEIYYIGLGKMGMGMVEQLLEKGWQVHAFDVNQEARDYAASKGAITANSVAELYADRGDESITSWIMVPYKFVDNVLDDITPYLTSGDTIIDGGNSPYQHAVERAGDVATTGVEFMDVGVSGGPKGARNGACLMIGGNPDTYNQHEELFKDLAAKDAYQYLGKTGAGHYIKMVHNGIEYGMMQSIAEGFDLMAQSEFNPNLKDIVRIYQQQSVITSRLVGWLGEGFDIYGTDLTEVSGSVGALGEGQWTIDAAHRDGMTIPAIEAALATRLETQKQPTYRGKLLQTMRNMFGGHSGVTKIES